MTFGLIIWVAAVLWTGVMIWAQNWPAAFISGSCAVLLTGIILIRFRQEW